MRYDLNRGFRHDFQPKYLISVGLSSFSPLILLSAHHYFASFFLSFYTNVSCLFCVFAIPQFHSITSGLMEVARRQPYVAARVTTRIHGK